jgi:hypothetical protein
VAYVKDVYFHWTPPTSFDLNEKRHGVRRALHSQHKRQFNNDDLLPSAAQAVEGRSCFGTAEAMPFPMVSDSPKACAICLDGLDRYFGRALQELPH